LKEKVKKQYGRMNGKKWKNSEIISKVSVSVTDEEESVCPIAL
jgi:hypothetical protein